MESTIKAREIQSLFIFLLFISLLVSACQHTENLIDSNNANPSLILDQKDLPEYELNLDHKGFIEEFSNEFYHRGMITYRTVCFNCHGNVEQEGSMPNSQKFWKDTFKNGNDPYSIYETLTRGYGLMAPQVHLSPQEKYEVIQFIREEFVKNANPDEYFEITEAYLDNLSKGDSMGPEPKEYTPWADMDYGNFLIHTYELSDSTRSPRVISRNRSPRTNEDYNDVNFAYKGIAIRLDPGEGGIGKGKVFALFDHDLMRFVGMWSGDGFMDYRGILLNDEHEIYPRTVGKIHIENPVAPGWANPSSGDFKDVRFKAIDNRPFGPLPKEWAQFKGLYRYGDQTILEYSVGQALILEKYALEEYSHLPVISRTLNISNFSSSLKLKIAPASTAVAIHGEEHELEEKNGFYYVTLNPNGPSKVKIYMANGAYKGIDRFVISGENADDLSKYTGGGPSLYQDEKLTSTITYGHNAQAYEVDVINLPFQNPWKSRMRPTGLEFINDGAEALVTTIDGEVWRISGYDNEEGIVNWKRIATGLYQPLGLIYIEGSIYVSCRDQIVVLRDLNDDGETDYYESFNSDHQVTEHFHEFAMGLQIDRQGNFYYAKSGRHARRALIPQHGTLIKVTPDGSKSEIIATGFRAANGVCINPDGTFFVTDQEGYWNPMNRINHVTQDGFYGNMYGYDPPKDSSDAAMIPPMMWVDMKYDRSPAELMWATSERWGPLNNSLLSLSYGYGKIFKVMPQKVGRFLQSAMVELPVPQFPTGIMRGKINPSDGQLYVCGMSAWATSQMLQVGGLYRIRYTGKSLNLPVSFNATTDGLEITFSDPIDPEVAIDLSQYEVNTWELERTRNYGSDRFDFCNLKLTKAHISQDAKTINLSIPNIKPVKIMEVLYDLKSASGESFDGAIQNTIHRLERLSIEN